MNNQEFRHYIHAKTGEILKTPGLYVIRNIVTGRLYLGESQKAGLRLRGHFAVIDKTLGYKNPWSEYSASHKGMAKDRADHGIESFRVMLAKEERNRQTRRKIEAELTRHLIERHGADKLYSTFHAGHHLPKALEASTSS